MGMPVKHGVNKMAHKLGFKEGISVTLFGKELG
jgi:hypothetical protein